MKSILDHYELWYESLKEICQKAGKQKVTDVMYKLTQGEYVKDDSGLNEAVTSKSWDVINPFWSAGVKSLSEY